MNFSFSPEEYELVRFGVCEDAARWAWTRFLAIGTPAWLVLGQHNTEDLQDDRIWRDEDDWTEHAWIVLLEKEESLLFEATAGETGKFLVAREKMDAYRPHLSLGPDGRIHRHRPWRKLYVPDDQAPRGYRLVRPTDTPEPPPEGNRTTTNHPDSGESPQG